MIVTVLCKKTHKRSPNFKIPLTENSRKCKCSSIDGRHTGNQCSREAEVRVGEEGIRKEFRETFRDGAYT